MDPGESNQRQSVSYERLLVAAPIALVVCDERRRIVLANAEAGRLLGSDPNGLIGRASDVLFTPATVEAWQRAQAEALEQGRSRALGSGLRVSLRYADGSELPVEAAIWRLDDEDRSLTATALRSLASELEGERERQSLETRLRRATGSQALDAEIGQTGRLETVGQLAGGIAHDFNNILGVIINYAQFVIDELDEKSSVRSDVEEIWRAARRGAALTRQLTLFSRHESQTLEAIDLNDVVSELEALLARTLGEHIELKTDLSADLWPIEADRGQIEQALVNLALNSRDAMREGGTLTVSTANVELDESEAVLHPNVEAGPFVRLTVEDTGIGMDGEVAARAFEPFFTTKPQGEGTGLGLAIVYGIVTSAGGTATISSEPGRGTAISTRFPATGAAAEPESKRVVDAEEPSGETVLIVEDDPSMRRMAERILRRAGYEVLASAGGRDALHKLETTEGIDLLLTDVVMPEMSGTELAGRAGALYPDLRILLMSGYVDRPGVGPVESGAQLLEKPFRAEDLLEKVRGVLRSKPRPG